MPQRSQGPRGADLRDAWPPTPTSVATPISHRRGTHRAAEKRDGRQAVPARTDVLWLLGAAAAFTVAVLALNPLHQGFSWDETVYISQISKHTPALPWAAERARGMPLLVAPVTLFTSSPAALRVYLSVLAGAALFLALLAWRRLRPAWVLALAGLVFGGLWAAQAAAPLVFPNFWAAVGALAGAGLFLRGVTKIGSPRVNTSLLGVAVAFTTLMRPADAVFLFIPLLLLALTVTAWRSSRFSIVTAILACPSRRHGRAGLRPRGVARRGLPVLRRPRGQAPGYQSRQRRHRTSPAQRSSAYEREDELDISRNPRMVGRLHPARRAWRLGR